MEEKYKMQIACSQVDMILNFYNQELLDMTIPKAVREYIRNNKKRCIYGRGFCRRYNAFLTESSKSLRSSYSVWNRIAT